MTLADLKRATALWFINSVRGDQFRRVELKDSTRWGLLGKGGVLMVSSYPNRTSPVLRGNYVLERILGTPPPIPPPGVSPLEQAANGAKKVMTVREMLETHRQKPQCFSCHVALDPLGFVLEGFDATGKSRTMDRFARTEIDMLGTMPDGTIGYTRDGSFKVDAQGRLVTSGGLPVINGVTIPAKKIECAEVSTPEHAKSTPAEPPPVAPRDEHR